MGQQFVIKPETRTRCGIIKLDEKSRRRFVVINMELFHFLLDAKKIDFSIYFRVGDEMIEYIRKEEYSHELLNQIIEVMRRDYADVSVMLLKMDQDKFDATIDRVRTLKMDALLLREPHLDRKVLDLFSKLSSASQLIVKGGINAATADKVKASASFMVSNLMDSGVAIGTLSRMVICDSTLYDHSASVAMIAGVIATKILKKPLGQRDAEIVSQCALYHDVGKTCVPNHILNKPGKFTPEEFEIMKSHTILGSEELQKCVHAGANIHPMAIRTALEHHEKFNGKGYPHGRKGRLEEDEAKGIHLFSRIVTIADVYSALLMKRVYKDAFESQDAIKIMAECVDDYDPEIFNGFLTDVVKSLNALQEKTNSKGRLLYFDESGKLQEKKRPA